MKEPGWGDGTLGEGERMRRSRHGGDGVGGRKYSC